MADELGEFEIGETDTAQPPDLTFSDPAQSVAALGAEARGGRTAFGTDALIACDQLVRMFSTRPSSDGRKECH